jgi:thioredoxin 1
MSNALEVDEKSFEAEVLNSEAPVLVDFWATWCGPCRKLGPVLDEISQDYSDKLKVVKVNTDENMNIAKDYSISGLPTLLIFKDGKAQERMVGLMPKSTITKNIEKYV